MIHWYLFGHDGIILHIQYCVRNQVFFFPPTDDSAMMFEMLEAELGSHPQMTWIFDRKILHLTANECLDNRSHLNNAWNEVLVGSCNPSHLSYVRLGARCPTIIVACPKPAITSLWRSLFFFIIHKANSVLPLDMVRWLISSNPLHLQLFPLHNSRKQITLRKVENVTFPEGNLYS